MNLKSSFLLVLIVGQTFIANSQINKIYATSNAVNDKGAVISADIDGSNMEIIVNDGEPLTPESDLLFHNDRMWGLTRGGGKYSGGTLFSVDMNLGDLQIHHHFHLSTGIRPWGSLILADGYLWGTAAEGGTSENGVVFKTNADGSGYTIVLDTELETPGAELISLDEKIYGFAKGGEHDYGIIFRVDYNGENFENIHDFDGVNGQLPDGKMTYDGTKLWGVCEYSVSEVTASTSDTGVIFTINTDGSSYTAVEKISRRPNGSLLLYDGKLWGTTWGGGENLWGSIFSIATNGTGYTIEHSFDNTVGNFPEGSIIEKDGLLWGMTYQGDIFSFNPETEEMIGHHEFSIYRDNSPYGGLVDVDGHFWGTTTSNFRGTGSVFKIDNDGTDYESLQFSKLITDISRYGAYRYGYEFDGKLLFYQNRLFGVMRSGGELYNYYGGIFSVNTDGTDFKHLHYFELEDGEEPHGSLIALNGKIWGVNYKHGNSLAGTLFSYDLKEETFQVELDFSDAIESGYQPGPVVAHEGMIYGTTYSGGGVGSFGLVYSFNPVTGERITLHNFSNDGLSRPSTYLKVINGKLYGRTNFNSGSARLGIYSIDLSDNSYEVVYTTNDVLETVANSDTHFYMLTNTGGDNSQGFIRKVALDGTGEEDLHHLAEEDGNFIGQPTYYAGKIWGAMAYSGAHDEGFIFTYDETEGFQNIMDFDADTKMPTDRFELLIVGEQEQPEMEFEVADQVYGNASFELEAFSSSGAPIIYDSSDPSVIEVTGNTAEVIGAGECTISASQDENVNYEEIEEGVLVEVAPASLTITANDQSRTYGDENPTLTMSYDGFVNGDDADDLSEQPEIGTTATGSSDTGTYDITVTGGDSDNYELTRENGTLTVNKASLTISVEDSTITATASIPEFAVVYEGFVNGDSEEDIVPPSISTDAVAGTAGDYAIELSGGSASNYTLTLVDGTLTIEAPVVDEPGDEPNDDPALDDPVLSLGELNDELSVYPNPARSFIILNGASQVNRVELFNLQGQLIKTINGSSNQFDLQGLDKGVYLLKIYGDQPAVMRLIKN